MFRLFKVLTTLILVLLTKTASGKTLLALGDSVAAGTIGHQSYFSGEGFVDVLFRALQANHSFDTLVNAACPGETSSNLLVPYDVTSNSTECTRNVEYVPSRCYSGFCDEETFPKGVEGDSQIDGVEKFLASSSDDVGLIVISIGANDVNHCDTSNFATCVPLAFQTLSVNLAEILTRVQMAAPGVPVIGLWYHNPYQAFYLPNGSDSFADAFESVMNAFNSLLDGVYAGFGASVANGHSAINGYDQSGDPRQDVLNVCMYTGMCTLVDGEWYLAEDYDIHPNAGGYELMGLEFLDVVESEGLLLDSRPTVSPTVVPTSSPSLQSQGTDSPTGTPTNPAADSGTKHSIATLFTSLVVVTGIAQLL
eukprot:Nitzschia sp. Nitz4//scaffold156_size52432//289//1383//NITZ4_006820-RA/size52432-processed-gene-0.25-mRNA-1//-1//CDS//3329537394//7342//frame0